MCERTERTNAYENRKKEILRKQKESMIERIERKNVCENRKKECM